MQIAVLTFDGFNELDSFVAAAILNRMKPQGWKAHITCPTPEVTSMKPAIIRRRVVLPHPDGPSRNESFPSGISRFTASTATVSPKRRVTFSMRIAVMGGRKIAAAR